MYICFGAYTLEQLLDVTKYECKSELEQELWNRLDDLLKSYTNKINELEQENKELKQEIEEYKESGSIFMEQIEQLEKQIENMNS